MTARHRAFTLIEMLITCAVLAVVVAVAIPSSQPVAEFRANAAAAEVARALRFAREEAMRTGTMLTLGCDTGKNTLSVYVPNSSGGVASTVKDPLGKMDYTFVLAQAPTGNGAALTACSFAFGANSASNLAFDANGNPVVGPNAIKVKKDTLDSGTALSSGSIQLAIGRVTRTVAVDANGRVTVS